MKGKRKVLCAKKSLKKLLAWWGWLKKTIKDHYWRKVSFKFKSNLSGFNLHLSWHYSSFCHYSFSLSLSENFLGYRNYHLRPLCVFWLGDSFLLTKLTDPRLWPKLFSTYSAFQGGGRSAWQGLGRGGVVFIYPMEANYFKSGLFQNTEHCLLLLVSPGVRAAQQF